MIPGKNDCIDFDASCNLSLMTRLYNNLITMDDEPEIIFGGAYKIFITWVYNLQITYPNIEIYISTMTCLPVFDSESTIQT